MNERIMIVDDEADLREHLVAFFVEKQYQVIEAADGAGVRQSLTGPQPAVIVLDLVLPDANGLELMPLLKKHWPTTEVIILTGHASIDAAVTATKQGAYDFKTKPYSLESLLITVERALEHRQLTEETRSLRAALSISGGAPPVFSSAAMKEVVRTTQRVAPTDVSVLLTGESGTGKEVVADLLHALSPRNKGPFIKINCAALPHELIESELFGSVKGAYTGAQSDREGLFHQAEGGTLLLDELSEMPPDTQSKLLRVLQEKEYRPVGGRTSFKANCRVIATTNRVVEEALRLGKLREDLFYRISTFTIALPPLRERREDILPLANAFLKRFAAQAGRIILGFSQEAADRLQEFDWPGNVRQLQNEVQRAVLMSDGQMIDETDLSIATPKSQESESKLTMMAAMERNTIIQILRQTQGNKVETAKRLGIGRQTLYNKIKQYDIKV